MTLPNSVYPNASLWAQNRGAQAWTDEPNPYLYVQKVSSVIHMNLHLAGQLAGVFEDEPDVMGADNFGFNRIDPVSAQIDTKRYKEVHLKEVYDTLVAAHPGLADYLEYYRQPTSDIRWAFSTQVTVREILGADIDRLFMNVDLTNKHVMGALAAIGRQEDQIKIDAAFGAAVAGMNRAGETFSTTSWSPDTNGTNGMKLFASDGVGLTDNKINEVVRYFGNKGVNPMNLVAIISYNQLSDFMQPSTSNLHLSSDYVGTHPMMSYAIPNGFYGIGRWVVVGTEPGVATESAILPTTNGERRCIFCTRDAIKSYRSQAPQPRYDEPERLDYAKVMILKSMTGAVRIEEKRMVEVRCIES